MSTRSGVEGLSVERIGSSSVDGFEGSLHHGEFTLDCRPTRRSRNPTGCASRRRRRHLARGRPKAHRPTGESPAGARSMHSFLVGGQTLVIPSEPVAAKTGDARVASGLMSSRRSHSRCLPMSRSSTPKATKSVTVEVTAARAGSAGVAPPRTCHAGWSAAPATAGFPSARTSAINRTFTFTLTSPFAGGAGHGARGRRDRGREIQPPAHGDSLRPHSAPAFAGARAAESRQPSRTPPSGKAVGYLPGAGDDTWPSASRRWATSSASSPAPT
jgi:hypothetical protein